MLIRNFRSWLCLQGHVPVFARESHVGRRAREEDGTRSLPRKRRLRPPRPGPWPLALRPPGWGQGAASLGGRDGPCGPLTAPSLDLKCAHLFSNENGKGGKEHGAVAAAVTGWRARTYSRPRSRESSQVTPEVPSAWNVPEPVSSLLLGHPRAGPGSPGGGVEPSAEPGLGRPQVPSLTSPCLKWGPERQLLRDRRERPASRHPRVGVWQAVSVRHVLLSSRASPLKGRKTSRGPSLRLGPTSSWEDQCAAQ